jgi:hypothetical protein
MVLIGARWGSVDGAKRGGGVVGSVRTVACNTIRGKKWPRCYLDQMGSSLSLKIRFDQFSYLLA